MLMCTAWLSHNSHWHADISYTRLPVNNFPDEGLHLSLYLTYAHTPLCWISGISRVPASSEEHSRPPSWPRKTAARHGGSSRSWSGQHGTPVSDPPDEPEGTWANTTGPSHTYSAQCLLVSGSLTHFLKPANTVIPNEVVCLTSQHYECVVFTMCVGRRDH